MFRGLSQLLSTQDAAPKMMVSHLPAKRIDTSAFRSIMVLLIATLLAGCGASSNTANSSFANQHLADGAARPGAEPASFTTKTGNSGYKIGPFDVLDISVFQVEELTKTVQVANTGTINLPLVGEVRVAGRTAQEVERDLASRLGAEYLQNPQVTVYVKEYNSQSVTVSGAVKKPGIYTIRGRTSLVQAVVMAGDFDDGADSNVLILRENDGKRMAAKFDVSAIQKGQAEDPILQAGDQIVAGSSAIKKGFNAILKAVPVVGTFALL
jgi:polysaccharide export outer membrane protein